MLADVSEGGFRADADRANIDVDGLGRFTVAWVSKPDGYEQQQVAARVFATDTTAKTITPLTASFLPFLNAAPQGGIRSVGMSVAMTTKQILIAAKGEINLQNKPELGVNSVKELNFYTVISHPSPKEDPTTPVGGGVQPQNPHRSRRCEPEDHFRPAAAAGGLGVRGGPDHHRPVGAPGGCQHAGHDPARRRSPALPPRGQELTPFASRLPEPGFPEAG